MTTSFSQAKHNNSPIWYFRLPNTIVNKSGDLDALTSCAKKILKHKNQLSEIMAPVKVDDWTLDVKQSNYENPYGKTFNKIITKFTLVVNGEQIVINDDTIGDNNPLDAAMYSHSNQSGIYSNPFSEFVCVIENEAIEKYNQILLDFYSSVFYISNVIKDILTSSYDKQHENSGNIKE